MIETVLIGLAGLVAGGVIVALVLLLRPKPVAGPDPAAERMAELSRAQIETSGHMRALYQMLESKQAELQRTVNDRLEKVTDRLGLSLKESRDSTTANLQKLNERLAVIDSAQKNITDLATTVTSLQAVLGSKQQRGAFGQSRMEIIVQDGLPKDCYAFQSTLSNKSRPDCCVFLPDSPRLVIDAKFPLEAVTLFREAKSDEERKIASARIRQDVGKHIADIAEKYLIPGETQDLALMFVPSESIYAELYDSFDDMFQKAYRAKVIIVSPSLLMLAIQVIQQIRKDARMREAAGKIVEEVALMMDDVGRLRDRVGNLEKHFGNVNTDIRQIVTSADKIVDRGERIQQVDFGAAAPASAQILPGPVPRKLGTGE